MKKIRLITRIIDIDVLSETSIIYDPLWSEQFLYVQGQGAPKDIDISTIEIGQAHTILSLNNGKVYSFGWNDKFQLGHHTKNNKHIHTCTPLSIADGNARLKSVKIVLYVLNII